MYGERDLQFKPIIDKLYGYHQVKFITPFDNAIWAILSQRVPMSVGTSLKRKLAEAFGQKIEIDGKSYLASPDPATLASIPAEDLQAVIKNDVKVERILSAAVAFQQQSLAWMQSAPFDEVETWLLSIKGIGEWSSNFILIRGIGRMELPPTSEKRLFDIIESLYGQKATNKSVRMIAQSYANYQGYWAHYLRIAG